RKVYDILMVCVATQDQSTRASFLQQLLSNTKPFALCVLLHHLDQLSILPVSSNYSSIITQFRQHLVDSVDLINGLLHSQIETIFEKSQSKSLDCDILVNMF